MSCCTAVLCGVIAGRLKTRMRETNYDVVVANGDIAMETPYARRPDVEAAQKFLSS
jgi:hypothetical protein